MPLTRQVRMRADQLAKIRAALENDLLRVITRRSVVLHLRQRGASRLRDEYANLVKGLSEAIIDFMAIDKVAALRATVLFGSLTNEGLRALASLSTEHKQTKGYLQPTRVKPRTKPLNSRILTIASPRKGKCMTKILELLMGSTSTGAAAGKGYDLSHSVDKHVG